MRDELNILETLLLESFPEVHTGENTAARDLLDRIHTELLRPIYNGGTHAQV